MAKTKMSKNFARFAKNTTSGTFDEVRKAERTVRGIPFDFGDKGTATMELFCGDKPYDKDDPDEVYPLVSVTLTVLTPEKQKGTELNDALNLTWYIKDSEKPGSDWTAEDAWGSMLEDLERLGVPNEITSGYEDFQEVMDWIDAEPRIVEWIIEEGDVYRGRKQKRVLAFAHVEESEKPSADDSEEVSFSKDTKYCTYRGIKYGILEEKEDDLLLIKNTQTGKERTVAAASVQMEA